MGQSATLERRLPELFETVEPLNVNSPSAEEAPQFFGQIFQAIANAWVNNACGPGIVHRMEDHADADARVSSPSSIDDLVSARMDVVA